MIELAREINKFIAQKQKKNQWQPSRSVKHVTKQLTILSHFDRTSTHKQTICGFLPEKIEEESYTINIHAIMWYTDASFLYWTM